MHHLRTKRSSFEASVLFTGNDRKLYNCYKISTKSELTESDMQTQETPQDCCEHGLITHKASQVTTDKEDDGREHKNLHIAMTCTYSFLSVNIYK